METYKAAPDIDVITANFPLPGFGFVPINAFVLKGKEPILVDTGAVVQSEEFLPALRSLIDPPDLRWLFLTHTDADHTGSLHALLAENPRLRVITSFLSVGIMGLSAPLPMDRVHLLNPGERLSLGDRTLTAIRPPTFDNPATTGFYDDKSRVLFSSDCFGALLTEPAQNAADLSEKSLRDGQIFWTTLDSPWLHKADKSAIVAELDLIRQMEPSRILSSHLPAATKEMTDRLLRAVEDAQSAPAFAPPNQEALLSMLTGNVGVGAR
jgi:flavorubredoxin